MKTRLLVLLVLLFSHAYGQMFDTPVVERVDFETRPVLLWKYKAHGPIVAAPVIDNGTVFVGSLDSCLYAIDLKTGKLKWKLPTTGAIRSSVCVVPKRLFLLSTDGFLYRMEKDSGKVDGFFQTMGGFMGDRQHDYADYFSSTPVIVDSTIYFGSGETIFALGINDGYLRWSYTTGDLVHTRPVISKGRLYAGSFDGHLYAIETQTGQLIWKFKTTGKYTFPKGEVTGNPLLAAGMVFAGARDNNLYAIDTKGGFCNWMKSFPSGWALSVTYNDSVIYVGTSDDRLLCALDIRTGDEVWKTPAGFNVFGGCALGQKIGYFATLAGKVYGIDLKTGVIKWTIELDSYKANHLTWLKPDDSYRADISKLIHTPLDMLKMYQQLGGVFGTPALETNHIVVAGYDGLVYCFSDEVKAGDKK